MSGSLDKYHKFLGKELDKVSDDITPLAKADGYTVNILDSSFPRNIDVEHHRLNFYVDHAFIIRKVFLG